MRSGASFLLRMLFCLLALAVSAGLASAQSWIRLAPTGGPPPERDFGATTVFDPASDSMILFGGAGPGCGGRCNFNDVWVLSHADGLGGTPAWTQLSPTGGPAPARDNHTAVYDAANHRMIIFGGCEGGCLPVANDVWVLTNANGAGGVPVWVPLSPAGGPPAARQSHVAAYDPNTNTMMIFGGQNGGCCASGDFSDVWVLTDANGTGTCGSSPCSPVWTQLSPSGGPPAGLSGDDVFYSPSSNHLTVFSGGTLSGPASTAVWTLSNANGTGGTPVWTQLIAEGQTGSPPQSTLGATDDPVADQMLLSSPNAMNDMWILSHADGVGGAAAWTHLTPTGGPSSNGNGQVFNRSSGRLTEFLTVSVSGNNQNQVWVLPNANGATQLLATIPLTNGSIYLNTPAIDPNTNRIYTAGGASFDSVPVQVIDGNTNTTVGALGSGTAGVRVNAVTNMLYFGQLSPSQILAYDISGAGVGTQTHTFNASGCAIEAYPDTGNNRIWGASQCGGGSGLGGDPIIVIDGNSNTVLQQNIGSGGVMGQLVVNPVTHKAYIGPSGTSKEIDPNTFAVTNTPFGGVVQAVNATTNTLYATSSSTALQVVNGSNETVIATISGFTGISGNGVAVNPTRNRLYVLDAGASPPIVDVFDGSSNTQIGTISLPTGASSFGGMDVNPSTGKVYVSANSNLYVFADNLGLASSSTTLTSSANPSTVGQSVTFTATVSGSGGTPTGAVTFLDGSATLGTGTLNAAGVATFATSSLAAGSHSITASYAGDSNFGPSTSAALTQSVTSGVSGSSTALASSLNPSTFGASVTFTATVSGSGGTPTGTVTFTDGSTTLGTGTLNGAAQATLATAALTAGSHSLTAAYSGDSKFSSSTSPALAQTVNQATSATALSSSVNPSTVGQAVTFTATVSGAGSAPTGTVTFKDGATALGTGTLNGAGLATFTTSSLASGVHSITAAYGGDTNYQASSSSPVSQTVNQNTAIVATIALSGASAGSIYLHQPAIDPATNRLYTAGGASFDTVPVTVIDGNSNTIVGTIGSGAAGATVNAATNTLYFAELSPSQILAYDISGTGLGTQTHTFSANGCAIESYPDTGDNRVWGASQCGGGNDPIIVIDASVNPPAVLAQAIGSGGVNGPLVVNPVTHKAYIGPSGVSKEIDPSTFAVSNTAFGVVQTVNGATNTLYAASGASLQVINGATEAVIKTLSGFGAISGVAVNPTRNRFYVVDGPNAQVDVFDGGSNTQIGAGIALPAGDTSIGGIDVNPTTGRIYVSASSNGSNFSIIVINDALGQTATSTTVTSSTNPSTLTQSVTFTAAVSGSGATGTVTFKDGASALCGASPLPACPTLSSGSASLATAALAVGNHSITAVYSGDSSFSGSTSAAITQTVGQAASATGLGSSPNPSNTNQSVTFTATATGVGTITPTGTVAFLDGATTLGSGTLTAGTAPKAQATFTTSALAAGPHSITAVYGGDTNFSSSTSSAVTQTVNAPTVTSSTTLSESTTTSNFGQPVTFTATVTGSGSANTPTGTVTFKDGANALGSGGLNGSAIATLSTSALAAGTHSITAAYSGDATFPSSSSSPVTQVVSGQSSQYLQGTNYNIDSTQFVRYAISSDASGNQLDLNNDGKTDVVVTTSTGLALLLGKGDGTFGQPQQVNYPAGAQISWIAAGKFTGSGNQDLAVANSSGTVDILPGNGKGGFGATLHSALSGATQLAVADFRGVNKLDIAAITSGSQNVSVLLGNGDGTFASPVTYAAGGTPVAITAADFNGDGRPDLVTINNDGSVSLLAGKGDGTFRSAATYPLGVANAAAVASADLNGDGAPDLIVTSSADYSIRVLLNNTDGTFQFPVSYPAGAGTVDSISRSIAIGDFDGDGKLDLAIPDGGNASILFGNGDGTFQPPLSYAAHPLLPPSTTTNGGAGSVAAGDFTGNGKLSLAVANQLSNDLTVLLGNGDGSFQGVGVYTTDAAPGAVAVGDFNGDGRQDQVIANRAGNTVSVLLRKANGTFKPGVAYQVGVNPQGVAVGSFRNNGALDIATVNTLSNDVSVLLNDGHGSFTQAPGSPISIGSNQSPRAIRIEDFDGDGKLDIVVTNHNTDSLTVLFGKGDGTFSPFVLFSVAPPGPRHTTNAPQFGLGAMVTADFNNDGTKDMAVVEATTNAVGVILNLGAKTFSPLNPFPVGSLPVALAAGDLRNLGVEDLVVANQNDNTVTVLLNGTAAKAKTPVFTTKATVPVGVQPSSVALLDLNGDGKLDLAVVNSGDNTVATLLGNGDGTFQAPATYSIGVNPQSVAVGNFSGGGLLDLGAANNGANSVSVLLNKGATVMTVASSANPAVVGQSITFTVNLNSGVKGLGTPTGTVTFDADGATLGSAPLAAGLASISSSALPLGSHTITAFYGGDANFLPRITSPLVQVVRSSAARVPSSTALTVAPSNSASFGTSVTFSAQVTVSAGSPTGSVTFADNGVALGAPAPLNGAGVASFSVSSLSVGSHSITATYGGDPNFAPSTSQPLTQTVTQASTVTAFTHIGPSPAEFGQTVTVALQVSSPSGTPTGTVTLSDNGSGIGSATITSGSATFMLTTLGVGSHSLQAVYSGDTTFKTSSNVATLQVNQAPSATALLSSFNPSGAGNPVTFTASVTSGTGGGTPTGTVTFSSSPGVTFSCVPCPLNASGQATASVTFSPASVPATFMISAGYSGDTNFEVSAAPTLNQKVLNATSTGVSGSPNPSAFNQAVTFTASVTSGAGTPTSGTVTFLDGATVLGTGPVNASGQATFTTAAASPLSAGAHNITASYSGDNTTFAGSSSVAATQTVMSLNFTLTAMHPPTPRTAAIGRPLTFTFQVTNNSGGSVANLAFTGSLTGKFIFQSANTNVGGPCTGAGPVSCPLGTMTSNQMATITVTVFPLFPTHSINANLTVNATTNPATPPGGDTAQVRPRPFTN